MNRDYYMSSKILEDIGLNLELVRVNYPRRRSISTSFPMAKYSFQMRFKWSQLMHGNDMWHNLWKWFNSWHVLQMIVVLRGCLDKLDLEQTSICGLMY